MAKRKGPAGASDGQPLAWAADLLGVAVQDLVLEGIEVQRDIRFSVERVAEGSRTSDRYRVRLVRSHSAFWDEAKPAAKVQAWLHEDGVFDHRQRAKSTLYEGEDGSVPLPDADPNLVSTIHEHRLRAVEEARESAVAEEVRDRLMDSRWWDGRKRRTVWVVYDDGGQVSYLNAMFVDRPAAETLAGPPLPEPVRSRGDRRLRVVEVGAWFAVFTGHEPTVLYVSDDFAEMCQWVRTNVGEPQIEPESPGDRLEAGGRVVRIRKVSLVEGPFAPIP